MSGDLSPTGISLLCDERGIVQKVLRDDIGISGLTPGQPLGHFVDSSSRIKLLNFLAELGANGTAFDWDISIRKEHQPGPLCLAGAQGTGKLMIVLAHTPLDALKMLETLMKINHEQDTILQTAIRNQMQSSHNQSESDEAIYDEISRLNNELITLQRDLAKKSVEMEWSNAEIRKLKSGTCSGYHRAQAD